MFYLKTAFGNLRRYKYRTLLSILICAVVVLFLNVYMGDLQKSREQLYGLPEKIPVQASVMNLAGGMESGLFIKEEFYDGVMSSKRVEEPKFTLQLVGIQDGEEQAVLAVNTWKAVPGAVEKMFALQGGTLDTFFAGDERKCLVTEGFMEEKQLAVGDEITLDLQCYRLDEEDHFSIYTEPLETVSYKIAGTIAEEKREDAENMPFPGIIIPMETARESYRSQGQKFFVDSGQFYVKNPLELNAFKKEMKKIGFMETLPQAEISKGGYALLVRDETFIRAAGSIEEGYKMLKGVLPVVLIVLAGAGFITSYLLTGGRKQEYAVMRSLGMNKKECLFTYIVEQGTAEIAGGVIGSVVAIGMIDADIKWMLVCLGVFLICFLTGTAAALYNLGRVSVMEVLTKAE